MAVSATAEEAKQIIEDESLAEEELLDELESSEIPSEIREARLQALQQQAKNFRLYKEQSHGQYTEITEEKAFLDLTTSEEKCIVHFCHEDFRRCAIMDTHLKVLSEKYFEAKFAKINVTKAKFFVEKLKIRILPAVFCFVKGMIVDRIIGFEELGNSDDFPLSILERRLGKSGVIAAKGLEEEQGSKSLFGHQRKQQEDSDSDGDW